MTTTDAQCDYVALENLASIAMPDEFFFYHFVNSHAESSNIWVYVVP